MLTSKLTLFALGFRTFFMMAGLSAVLLQAVWLLAYTGTISLPDYYGAVNWHAHEMLFGYTAAVIAGFILTAARNWTGKQTPAGNLLAGLTLLWLAGRIAPLLTVLPSWITAAIDFLFLPILAVTVFIPILQIRQWRNCIFPILLLLLAAANALVHMDLLGITGMTVRPGLEFGLFVILIMIVIMAGRVIPFFIERAVARAKPKRWRMIEILSIAGILLLAVTRVLEFNAMVIFWLAGISGVIHGLRFAGWISRPALGIPLLWVLLAGYAWIVVGLILMALSSLGWLAGSLPIHAFTAGTIGVLTLGMMARVALGHTGRPLHAHRATVYAFVFVNMAVVVRVLLPLLMPAYYMQLIMAAGLFWVIAFSLFLYVYFPILIRPRIDGAPG